MIKDNENELFIADQHNRLKFYAEWGCAFSVSRKTRLIFKKPPSEMEKEMWEQADKTRNAISETVRASETGEAISDLDEVQKLWFYCHYAAGVVLDRHKKEDSVKLVKFVLKQWNKWNEIQKKITALDILRICNKIYKVTRRAEIGELLCQIALAIFNKWNHSQSEKERLAEICLVSLKIFSTLDQKIKINHPAGAVTFSNVREAVSVYLGDNENNYLELSKLYYAYHENEKAVEILKNWKIKTGRFSRHVWLDIELLNRRRILKYKGRETMEAAELKENEEWVRREFKSLLKKYSDYNRNRATIMLKKSEYLFHEGKRKNTFLDYMDESMEGLVQARQIDPEATVRRKFYEDIKTILKANVTKNQANDKKRPEYLAWFYGNIDWDVNESDALSPEISRLFRECIDSIDVVDRRKQFAREQFGRFLLHKTREFDEAVKYFQQLPAENEYRKYLLSEAVFEKQQSGSFVSKELLLECLELGNYDVIEPILTLLENEKSSVNLNQELLKQDFFNEDQSHLFFSRKNYEICAMTEILLEENLAEGNSIKGFFVARSKTLSDIRDRILKTIVKLLEIPTDSPKLMANLWRRRRLDATKTYLLKSWFKDDPVFSEEEEYAFNVKLLDVFRDARNSLDRCVKKFCPDDRRNCYHPFAFKAKKEQEDKMNAMLHMKMDDVKKILTKDFGKKGLALTNDVCGAINFMAEREFHIIQIQGAWHAVWVEAINDDKHKEAWDMDTFEKDLKKYRDIGHVDDVTAYDVAHCAAEFAEQTMIILNMPVTMNGTA